MTSCGLGTLLYKAFLMSYKVKCWGEWWVMNLEGIWKELFVAQLGFSLEEMSKSINYFEMVADLAKI
jgi:hypothetical protein